MKTGTTNHPKFRSLQKRLELPTYAVVGILESVWMMAGQFADSGDLSRFTAEEIASAVDWTDDADALIEALVEFRWLDRSETGLSVHDWLEHCPKYVQDRLHKRQKRADVKPVVEVCRRKSATVGENRGLPNPTQPNQTKPNQERVGKPDAPSTSLDEIAAEWNTAMGQNCRPTTKRKAQAAARLKESWWRDNWRDAIRKAKASRFCKGENDRGWKADLEWFLQPDSATKLIEGKYSNAQPETAEERPMPPVVDIAARRAEIAREREGATAHV